MELKLVGLIFLLVVNITVAQTEIVNNIQILKNECNSNKLVIRSNIINIGNGTKNLTILYSTEDFFVLVSKNITLGGNVQWSSDDSIVAFLEEGKHTLFMNVVGEGTSHAEFEFRKCPENTDYVQQASDIIHSKLRNTQYEAWQAFLSTFLVANIIFSQFDKPLGKRGTVKTAPSLLFALVVTALLMYL